MNNMHIDPQHTALVIVDVQNDFCHDQGSKALKGADVTRAQAIVPIIENLIEQARRLGVPIVFIQTTHSAESSSEAWSNRPGAAGREDTVKKGTWGADFYKLLPSQEDIIIEKYRYSAFINTNLDDILRNLQRKSLIIVGIATNVCVESTTRDGFMLDYHVTLVKDGCAGYVPELEEATFRNIQSNFGLVLESAEILQYWNPDEARK